MGKTYSIKEAAAITNLHPNTIRGKVKDGSLQAEKTEGKYGLEYRISEASLVQAGLLTITDAVPKSDTSSVTGGIALDKWLERYEQAITRVSQLESERVYLLECKTQAEEKERALEEARLELERKKVELETAAARLEEKDKQIERLRKRSFFKRLFNIE
jgi:excisionase family DNA binding protein